MTRHRMVLLAVILLAFGLRLWDLPQTPPGLWYDEAYNSMDALWMAETGQYRPFLVGNNGREGMWHYLLLVSITLWGNSTFAVRWVGAVAGFITVPILYFFARSILSPFAADRSRQRWLALAAAGWLAVSWWHLLNSRAGFRPVLLPPFLMLCLYFWMAGVRGASSRVGPFVLAGLFLGLSQYTYLPARLVPLIFGGLVILGTLLAVRAGKRASLFAVGQLWLGLAVTAGVAAVVFLPLGLFFLQNPGAFSARTGDVIFTPDSVGKLAAHFFQGLTLFLGAGHELYRHHLPGRAMLGWLEIPFFWLGLFSLFRAGNLRRPETHLLLLGLIVMWLPALLASPPVHALRPIGMLPFYYLIVTLGLFYALRFRPRAGRTYLFPIVAGSVIIFNGLINTYDYFWRWASHPEVYQEYNGPLADLTRHLITMTKTTDLIIPFHLYVHPTTRYLLADTFSEGGGQPPPFDRPVEVLLVPSTFQLLYVGNIPDSPALTLLTRDQTGQGAAYVSRPPRAGEQEELNTLLAAEQANPIPFTDKLGRAVAQFVSLPDQPPPSAPSPDPDSFTLQQLFNPMPLRTTQITWPELVRLDGYDVTPELARPGQPVTLNLYWHSLTDKTFEHRLFLQLIDAAGNPINQWEGDAFREDMYRWRPEGILPSQHILWLGPDTPPGPYLVRLGFFEEESGRRLPLRAGESAEKPKTNAGTVLDQVQLGLFYVTDDGADPRLPATPLSANFAGSIKLIGTTFNLQPSTLPVTFYWQPLRPTGQPYTVFLQLLDEQGQVVSGWDGQPFGGLYPTTLWSPGEIVVDTFLVPLPPEGLPPGPYRLVTGFYDFDTGRRLPVAGGGDLAELGRVVVENP